MTRKVITYWKDGRPAVADDHGNLDSVVSTNAHRAEEGRFTLVNVEGTPYHVGQLQLDDRHCLLTNLPYMSANDLLRLTSYLPALANLLLELNVKPGASTSSVFGILTSLLDKEAFLGGMVKSGVDRELKSGVLPDVPMEWLADWREMNDICTVGQLVLMGKDALAGLSHVDEETAKTIYDNALSVLRSDVPEGTLLEPKFLRRIVPSALVKQWLKRKAWTVEELLALSDEEFAKMGGIDLEKVEKAKAKLTKVLGE